MAGGGGGGGRRAKSEERRAKSEERGDHGRLRRRKRVTRRRASGAHRSRAEFAKRQIVPRSHFGAETATEPSIQNTHSKGQKSKTNKGADRYENGT